MQLGFVIDHSRCIGCHACTVACKAENDVPIGDFRTWVKYTEKGAFPDVKRSFAVLRCNQCTNAPCVTICPVNALEKRAKDGIVDVNPKLCIGCKGCMQACPYDALYLNEAKGTAEKCHFCAHRAEVGLAPACAVVCPTEAIIPGDFHDPQSVVSKLKAGGELAARKVEAGTRPNVFYREAAAAGIDPMLTNGAGGYLWSDRLPGPQQDAELHLSLEKKAVARTVYDVAHPSKWGGMVSAYLFTKSIAAGVVLAAGLGGAGLLLGPWAAAAAIFFLLLTTGLLVGDLKRPERFLLILTNPNWNSWIAKGSVVLGAYGVLLTVWLGAGVFGVTVPAPIAAPLYALTAALAVLTAAYTAWLFGQAKGRPLWMKRGLAAHLVMQAGIAGTASLMTAAAIGFGASGAALRGGLAVCLGAHLLMMLLEGALAPANREEEYRRAASLLTHGPYARRHWGVSVIAGVVAPLALLFVAPSLEIVAALLALAGLFVYEDNFVRAGQALPIS